MKKITYWMRKPIAQLLMVVVVVAGMMEASERVKLAERRAISAERSAVDVATGASSTAALKSKVTDMEASLLSPEEPVALFQRIAGAQGVKIASSQSGGAVPEGEYDGAGFRVRVERVSLAPLTRLLNELEAARPGILIRELVVRKSIQNPKRLDAEFEVHFLQARKEAE